MVAIISAVWFKTTPTVFVSAGIFFAIMSTMSESSENVRVRTVSMTAGSSPCSATTDRKRS